MSAPFASSSFVNYGSRKGTNHFMFIYQRYGNKAFPFAQKLSFLGIACLSINAALHPEAWKGKEEIIVSAEAIYSLMKTEVERLS